MKKSLLIALLLHLLFTFQVTGAIPTSATPPAQDAAGQIYIVQADDWLSIIAEKFYGDPLTYPAIVEATNRKEAEDNTFQRIDNPDVIEIGQKLWIPDPISLAPPEVAERPGSRLLQSNFACGLKSRSGYDPNSWCGPIRRVDHGFCGWGSPLS